MDPARYLQRIEAAREGEPTMERIADLQAAHLMTVPFENLHVYHRRPVHTDVDWSYGKIVDDHRGGWCFELNGGFGWLLRSLGYDLDYVACRVFGDSGWASMATHCALVVRLHGMRWLVDVGFGDCCMIPVPLVDGEHPGIPRPVRCRIDGDEFVTTELMPDGRWVDQLWGSFQPRVMDDFTGASDHLRTAPGLQWTESVFATRATDRDGSRITLRGDVLRRRVGTGEFVDRPVSENEWSDLLLANFGIVDDRQPHASG